MFVLRPFREGDFDAALDLQRDTAASRWVPALPATDGAGVEAVYDEWRREGSLLHLVIADLRNDRYLGEAMLALTEHGVGEVGCCVVPAQRGRGIAVGALRALTNWSFATIGLGRVQVFVATGNAAALRLAGRAGFQREGVLRSYWEIEGTRVDAVVLARIAGDERQA